MADELLKWGVMVVILRPERVTPEQRYSLLFIARLQRLPCYHEILSHLTPGQSVRSLAAWLTNQKIEGPAGQWSRHYGEKLLQPLNQQVRAATISSASTNAKAFNVVR